uniref:Uncharacterized protein n=1 Tax=Panagrolaimus davidi TaxID=227884 RepID=A0A914PMX7_9BILA
MKNLYDKIKAVERDSKQWFQFLEETEDDEFISHNVEYRLGSNLLDKDLWKIYIEFLRQRNPKEMLQVYSKYCRFFISDLEMREKYRTLVYELGPVKVPWENPFEFETMDEKRVLNINENYGDEILQSENEPFVIVENAMMDLGKLSKEFFENSSPQNFSFINPVIRYILDNANHILLRKLYQSCKYFYAKKQVPICFRFETGIPLDSIRNFKYDEETFQLALPFENYNMLEMYYITTVFRSFNNEWNDCRMLSNIISRLYRCDAKYILISDQNLYFDEFKFLIGHGNVIKLDCQNVKVKYSENEPVALEDIMALLPNIKILQKANCLTFFFLAFTKSKKSRYFKLSMSLDYLISCL